MKDIVKKLIVGGALILTPNIANAGLMKIYNKGQPGVTGSILTVDNFDNPGSNADFNSSNIELGIYSKEGSRKLMLQSLPVGSQNLDFYLDVVGGAPLNSTDKLRFEVPDNTGFTSVQAYDLSDPDLKHNIPLNNGAGSFYDIILSDLVNQPAGEYATWRLDINPQEEAVVPEPSGLALMAMGAVALARKKTRAGTDPRRQ